MKFNFFKQNIKSASLINNSGIAKTDINPLGEVRVNNKRWKAKTYKNRLINKGDNIKVVNIKNLLLVVKKIR